MREEWTYQSLDALVELGWIELGRGKVISKKDLAQTPGPYPVYSSAKEADGKFGEYGLYMFDEELITWSVDGGGHLFHRPKHRFSVTNVGGTLRILKPEKLDYRFLYYMLSYVQSTIPFDWVLKAHPSVLRRLYTHLPVPSLPEQKRIVAILDEAFAGIAAATANAEKNLANARELLENYVDSVFLQQSESWIEKPIGSIGGDVFTGPFGSLLHKADYVTDGTPLVNPAHIIDGKIIPDTEKTIDLAALERLQNYRLKAGDVVIGRRGEIGRCAVVTAREDGWLCGTGCFYIRVFEETNPHFLAGLLRSKHYRQKLEALSTGATMLNLSNTTLSDFKIRVPPLAEQNDLMKAMESLSKQIELLEIVYQKKLSALAALKQAILQKAFSGELTALPEATQQEEAA